MAAEGQLPQLMEGDAVDEHVDDDDVVAAVAADEDVEGEAGGLEHVVVDVHAICGKGGNVF